MELLYVVADPAGRPEQEDALRAAGYRVRVVHSGRQEWSLAQQRPGLIILETMLGGGYLAICRQLRQLSPGQQIPVVLIEQNRSAVENFQLLAGRRPDAVVPRTTTAAGLVATIQATLDHRSRRRQFQQTDQPWLWLLEALPQPMALVDDLGTIIYTTPHFDELLPGPASKGSSGSQQSQLRGGFREPDNNCLWARFDPPEQELLRGLIQQAMRQQTTLRHRWARGDRWLQVSVRGLTDAEGHSLGAAVGVGDVTAEVQLQQQQQQRQRQQVQALRDEVAQYLHAQSTQHPSEPTSEAPSPAAANGAIPHLQPGQALHEALPATFQELTAAYAAVLDAVLKHRVYNPQYLAREELQYLGQRLAQLRAKPRDVIDLHRLTLKQQLRQANAARARSYLEEGRSVVLELMGHLAAEYHAVVTTSNPEGDPPMSSLPASPPPDEAARASSRPEPRESAMGKYLLKLYVTGQTPRAQQAIANLRRICEEDLRGEYTMQVIDVLERPQLAEDEKILATPTVVKELPLPIRRIIGDLSDTERVLVGLDLKTHAPQPLPTRIAKPKAESGDSSATETT